DGSFVVVHRGLGGGSFARGLAYLVASDIDGSLAAADANGDCHLDIYNASSIGDGTHILLGAGDGSFAPGPVVSFWAVPATFDVADIDRDGVPDLVGSGSFNYELQRMGHDGAIGPALKVSAGGQVTAMTVADLDED